MDTNIDKKNIAFVVLFFAIGLTFILVLYSISSNRNRTKRIDSKEEKEVVETDLMKNEDIKRLFRLFSKLDTDKNSLYINKNDHSKESDLSNEEKLFVVFKDITNKDFINVDCDNLSSSLVIPDNFVCTKGSYKIHRGVVMAKYDELFGYEKEIELNNFLTYLYDQESLFYIKFDLKDDNDDEYDLPRAVLKNAYIEDNKLIIKYHLDYSSSGSSFYDENVILTFKKENNKYIFLKKRVEIDV